MVNIAPNPAIYFNMIREGLEEALENSGGYATVGQVFQALESGEWTLWMFSDDDKGEYVGFGITEKLPTASGTWLNVPFAYAKDNMYGEFFGYLESIAYERGMTGVKFISSRPGFERRAKEYGWRKGFTEWIVADFRGKE